MGLGCGEGVAFCAMRVELVMCLVVYGKQFAAGPQWCGRMRPGTGLRNGISGMSWSVCCYY